MRDQTPKASQVGDTSSIIVNLGKTIALRIPAYNRDRGTA